MRTSFEQNYEALLSGCGMVELTDWSSVTVTGSDRQTFLHNFCTNDVKRLGVGDSCEAFFTNVKGKIVAHGVISCRDNELVIVGVPGQASRLIEHLERYVIREDVELRETSTERSYLLVAGGSDTRERLQEVNLENPALGHWPYISWNLVGNEFAGLIELTPRELSVVMAVVSGWGFVNVGLLAFTLARIEAGVPLMGVDFDDTNFPQEVGRDKEAISFMKGCYLGQETVARIDALGHVNQHIIGVKFSGSEVPAAGTELSRAGMKIGRVTSATFSRRLNAPLALAMLRREASAPGAALESAIGACEVVALPLADRP